MGCSQSKSQPITTLPKGATPEKAPTDYRRKNQYHIPVVLPPSRDSSQPIPKTNDDTIEAIIRSQNESNGNALTEKTNEDIRVNGTESVVVSNVEIIIEEVKDHEENIVVIETTEKTTRGVLVEQDDFKWNDIVDAPVDTETVEHPVESSQEEVIVELARKSVESLIEEAEDKLNQEPEEMSEPMMIRAYVEPTRDEAIAEFITSESIDEDQGNNTIESVQFEDTLQNNDEDLQKNEEAAPQDTTGGNGDEVSEELQVGTTASVEAVVESKEEPAIEERTIEEPTIEEQPNSTDKIMEENIAVPLETQESNQMEVDRVEPIKEDTDIVAKQIEEPSPDYTTEEPTIGENFKVPESNEGTVADVDPMEAKTEELKEEMLQEELSKNEENSNKELVEDSITNEEIVEKHDDQVPESTKEDNHQTVEPKEADDGEANQVNPEETHEVTKQDEKIPEVETTDQLEDSRKSIEVTVIPLIAIEEPNQKNTDDVSQENVMSKPESTTNVTESFKETESKLQTENNENTIGV